MKKILILITIVSTSIFLFKSLDSQKEILYTEVNLEHLPKVVIDSIRISTKSKDKIELREKIKALDLSNDEHKVLGEKLYLLGRTSHLSVDQKIEIYKVAKESLLKSYGEIK